MVSEQGPGESGQRLLQQPRGEAMSPRVGAWTGGGGGGEECGDCTDGPGLTGCPVWGESSCMGEQREVSERG